MELQQSARVAGRCACGRGSFHHRSILGDLARDALGYDAPLVQYRNAVRKRQDAVDVMLDQQHGMPGG
jgi:hypothetical protein